MNKIKLDEWANICGELAFNKKVSFQTDEHDLSIDLEERKCIITKDGNSINYYIDSQPSNSIEELCNIIYIVANKTLMIDKYGTDLFCKEFSPADVIKACLLSEIVNIYISNR